MKKNFTKLVCVGIACFCMSSAMPQESMTAFSKVVEMNFSEEEVKLRADEVEYWWPDSVIHYLSTGELRSKEYFDEETRTRTYVHLVDGNWIIDEPHSTNGYDLGNFDLVFWETANGGIYVGYQTIWYVPNITYGNCYSSATYDAKGNLISLGIIPNANPVPVAAITYRIKYNDENAPVLLERYAYDDLQDYTQFEYNENGHLILCKAYEYNREKNLMELSRIETLKFDEKGRPVEGHSRYFIRIYSDYTIFYYSDGIYKPDVEVDNNTHVGNNNQGSFDLEVNIPTDSISNGSITITFPEGFTLDEKNTSLTLDFADLFDLIITKQDNNSWMFEIKPKTLRNTMLRADEVKKMFQVAFTVDEKLQRGTYNISVNSILFETKGGNYIPEPAITVPAQLNRWGVSNVKVESNNIWASGGNLHIRTDKPCTLSVFTISGQVFRQQTIGAGETLLSLPQGIYFVKVGETTKKIIAK